MAAELSFVVVTWNSGDDLAGLIDSMSTHLPDTAKIELIVVDNASSDDPTPVARQWQGEVVCERLESNLGFGAAANRGVALSSAPVCVICNPDVRLIDDSIRALGALAAERQALVGPRLLWSDRTPQPSASGPVVGLWPWIGAVIPGSIQPRWMLSRTEPWRLGETTPVTWLTGAVVVAPTSLLRDLGPFDESIDLMYEDLDLCLRAGRSGIESVFAPEVSTVVHIGGTSREKRFDDAGLRRAQENRWKVIAGTFGSGSARMSTAALAIRLELRSVAKRMLGRDADAERAELTALKRASGARGGR